MNLSDNWKKDYPSAQDITEGLDENHSLKKMLRLVGEKNKGNRFWLCNWLFSQLLTRKGCRVTGIEINPDAAKVAELYCEQVIVADLDFVSVTELLLFTSLMLPYLEMYWNTFVTRGGCWRRRNSY